MEKKTIVRSDNHVTIDGWMINELELSGSELIVYGLIWGFSRCTPERPTGLLSAR